MMTEREVKREICTQLGKVRDATTWAAIHVSNSDYEAVHRSLHAMREQLEDACSLLSQMRDGGLTIAPDSAI